MQNPKAHDSASWLHPAIRDLMKQAEIDYKDLAAVGVSCGPGSYTGLRVGMATAKGICYAAGVPLITVNTLEMMAEGAGHLETGLICPMIDARRMEVFAQVYDRTGAKYLEQENHILNENSFADLLKSSTIGFFGNGSVKFKNLMHHSNAAFFEIDVSAESLSRPVIEAFRRKEFADLAYAEPQPGVCIFFS